MLKSNKLAMNQYSQQNMPSIHFTTNFCSQEAAIFDLGKPLIHIPTPQPACPSSPLLNLRPAAARSSEETLGLQYEIMQAEQQCLAKLGLGLGIIGLKRSLWG